MNAQKIITKILTVVAEELVIEQQKVTPHANFYNDLGADFLDIIELTLALESAFNIKIPDQESEKFATVQQTIDYISQKVVV